MSERQLVGAGAKAREQTGPLSERTASTVASVKAYLEQHRSGLVDMLGREGSSGLELAHKNAKIMDGLLTTFYPTAFANVARQRRMPPVLLAAVGGYGRQLLGLKSDLDVRFLTADATDRMRPLAEALLYPLWDAGISIGHQVVSVSDVLATARRDLPTATALLDFRAISGDAELAKTLSERAYAGIFEDGELPEFMQRLETEVTERHRRFGDSVYLLEPDVKSGAGGLRDLDIALWAARARWRASDVADLVRLGVLVSAEAAEMNRAADFLWTVRNHLHKLAGRRVDRLTFEAQEIIARAMGYRLRVGAPIGASEEQISGPMVEAFMSDYYRHARAITRARERIIVRATPRIGRRRPREEDLGHGLRAFDGQVTFADPKHLTAEPALALRLYATAVSRDLPVLPYARDVVGRAVADPAFCAMLRADAEAASLFVSLVCTARETRFRSGSVLAELHDVGLLVAMIPEFSPVVGRVHHDVYHVYTVDVHSVAAVDRLRALLRGDLIKTSPLACRVATEVARPEVLFLATLLHDVGKAIGGKDHSKRGADMAADILTRLGFSPSDVEEGCHLILKHLAMYVTSARRDIEDPATIAEFASNVRGREGLRDLYLLTVADLSTTSPTSMTPWKARMLDELYIATDRMLSGSAPSDAGRLFEMRERVKKAWGVHGDVRFLEEFLDTMPERYLLSNTAEEIAAHARVALGVRGMPVSAALVPSRHPDVAELCVVTDERTAKLCVVTGDRPGLLAAITAAIVASRLEVYAAHIHSRQLPDGGVQAVDLFWVRDRNEGAKGVARALPKLSRDLQNVITGGVAPRDLAKRPSSSPWSERPTPSVATHVSIDNRVSSRHTVIEVVTKDRPGLLFALAQALHGLGLTIAVAKIDTEGNRVADVFYVTETDGSKLQPGHRTNEVREGLLTALRALT